MRLDDHTSFIRGGNVSSLTEDPDLDNPELKIDGIVGNTLEYPHNGDFPLTYETNYYWRVVPKDINGNYGLQSSYSSVYQFTTTEYAELVGPLSGSIIETVRPTFEINTPIDISYITIKISDENDEDIQNPKIYNEEEKIAPSSSNFVINPYL